MPNQANYSIASPEKMDAFGKTMHSIQPSSPRLRLVADAARQAVQPKSYRSAVGQSLLERRNPGQTSRLVSKDQYWSTEKRKPINDGAFGNSDLGIAYVPENPPERQRDIYNAIGYETIANHELEHAQHQRGMPNDGKIREYGPVIGDLVFMGEKFQREEGKPLDHTVNFPGGSSHNIQWMQQQAKKHGYWDGRPMTDLLFGTPEGRAWLKSKMPGSPGVQRQMPGLGRFPEATPVQQPGVMTAGPVVRQIDHPSSQLAFDTSRNLSSPDTTPPENYSSSPPQRRAFGTTMPVINQNQSGNPLQQRILASPMSGAPARSQPPVQRQAGGPISPAAQAARQAVVPPASNPQGNYNPMQDPSVASVRQAFGQAADQYIAGVQQRQQANNAMPQYLRFADTQNQREVNSGLGIQMDYGNLPSSQTQLDFANRAENRGQRGDTLLRTVMNPVTYNGIRVNNQAIANNLSMDAGRRQELAQAGFEVSPEGVVRRAAPKQTGGSTMGFETLANTAANTVAGRERYGMSADGTDRNIPRGRAALIAARTDLTDAQKAQFLLNATANRRALGRNVPQAAMQAVNAINAGNASAVRNLPYYNQGPEGDMGIVTAGAAPSPQTFFDPVDGIREQMQGRIDRKNEREARYDGMRQAQAQAVAQQQQAQTMGMIAQQAMMGNPQAMQILGNMQMTPADAARIALGQQQMMLEGNRAQQDFMLRGQEMNQRNQLATMAEQNRAASEAAQNAFRQSQMQHNNKMEEMGLQTRNDQLEFQRSMQESEAKIREMQAKTDAEINPFKKELMQVELDRAKLELKDLQRKGGVDTQDTTEIANGLVQSGVDPQSANIMAEAEVARQGLLEYAKESPQAEKLSKMPAPSPEAEAAGGANYVEDFISKANQVLNFAPETYGGGIFGGGLRRDGANPDVDIRALALAMKQRQIDPLMIEQYINDNMPSLPSVAQFEEGMPTLEDALKENRITNSLYTQMKKIDLLSRANGGPGYTLNRPSGQPPYPFGSARPIYPGFVPNTAY